MAKKILVGLSGGVDSAVAAYLLKQQGYDVTAGFMKNYVDEENPNCTTYQDATEAIKVADFLGIELKAYDLIDEYEEKIVKYIYEGYEKGITPNPDILCNSLIKFDVFLEKAMKEGFDMIAMGHYARIEKREQEDTLLHKEGKGGSKFLYYNPNLKEKSRELRKNQTQAEKKLWHDFLSTYDYKFVRQKPIDEYIVDFYCHELNLVIEIDGDTHWSKEELAYDKRRTEKLNTYGIKVLRFTNEEVYTNFDEVCNKIIKKEPPKSPLQRGGKKETYRLLRGIDHNKDQSYFLAGLNQYQLSKSLFPLGEIDKSEVRKIAKEIGLPNADRPDSQGLCFIGKVPMKEFLKKRLPVSKGDIVLINGTKVGEHQGAYFFTIGQSRGLDINKKAYVVKVDVQKNQVIVSYDKQEPELSKSEIIASNRHWIANEHTLPFNCTTKIRYRQEPNPALLSHPELTCPANTAVVSGSSNGSSKFGHLSEGQKTKISYKEPQRGIAPGQTVVAYLGEECIGSGIIM